LSIRPRPEIERLGLCPHGGLDLAELESLELDPDQVVDFSVSSNPYSYPPAVKGIFSSVSIDRYPDSGAIALREALARKLGVKPDNILAGSGAMEIIRIIALTYFGHGDTVLCLKPTFGEYEVACRISGASVMEQWGKEADCFTFNTAETEALVKEYTPKGIFICNPGNPSGQYLSRQEVERILDASQQGLVVLDESYTAFTEGNWPSADLISRDNVVVVHSMTKDYALAGLRLGYALATRKVIADLRRTCPPWNVNAVAQQAGIIALEHSSYLKRCELKIRKAKHFLMTELCRLGFIVVPSSTNFFLVKVGDAGRFRSSLLRHGIIVRDCTSFGLPQYVRIAALKMDQCRRLIEIIATLVEKEELFFV
jgi:histidinol-phosphate aminotransferase